MRPPAQSWPRQQLSNLAPNSRSDGYGVAALAHRDLTPPRIPGGSGILSQTILLIFGKSESVGGGKQLHELPNAVSLRKRYIARVNSAFMYFSITCCA